MSDALLSACQAVLERAEHVKLVDDRLTKMAQTAPPHLLAVPDWRREAGSFAGHADDTITWLMIHNAINFCYWPDPEQPRWYTQVDGELIGQDDEAFGVMAALGSAIRSGVPMGDFRWLQQIEADELAALLAPAPGAGKLPMMRERLAALQELGGAKRLYSSPPSIFEAARGSAARFVQLLIDASPSFEDTQVYENISLPFRKRAWLCAAMIFGRFQDDPIRAFHDPEVIPVFADYRLPQLLRGAGALVLSDDLARRIDAEEQIAADSREEIELRAAAVVAAERLREELGVIHGVPPMRLQVDHFLWRTAVQVDAQLPPFHRTRTTRY
ncbi:MAG: hypothetical protein ACI8S6_005140 [Myxococcota bacterium]|jgi:hypothetical protein